MRLLFWRTAGVLCRYSQGSGIVTGVILVCMRCMESRASVGFTEDTVVLTLSSTQQFCPTHTYARFSSSHKETTCSFSLHTDMLS